MKEEYDYTYEDIVRALHEVGLQRGDNVFVHSNLAFFGKLKNATTRLDYYLAFKKGFFDVIGPEGTLIVPTFSYSFCRGEIFDKEKTPGLNMGFFSEMVRQDPTSYRSEDANFSVAAIGKNARYFTKDAPEYSFGPNSFWDKLLRMNGKICNLNLNAGSTFIHYVERELKVPYRWDKPFRGISIINGKRVERIFYHFVRDLEKPEYYPDFTKFDKLARELGLAKWCKLGRGEVVCISAKDTFELIKQNIARDLFFLSRGNR
ncbi:MAG: AAC(3) family N-acetyltransferase [Candidatus Aenigmatarchaeota archaeon]